MAYEEDRDAWSLFGMIAMTQFAMLVFFPALMAYAAASDLLTMTIANWISVALVALFMLFAVGYGLDMTDIGMHVAIGFVVLIVTFGLFAAGWIGGGDAKLAAATAIWMGTGQVMPYLMMASIFGGGLTLALLLMRRAPMPAYTMSWTWFSRLHDDRTGVPYGIALAAAGLAIYPSTDIWRAAFAA